MNNNRSSDHNNENSFYTGYDERKKYSGTEFYGNTDAPDEYGDLKYHGDNEEEYAEVTVKKEKTPALGKLFIALWLILTGFGFAAAFLFNEPWLLFPMPVQLLTGIMLLAVSEPKRRTKNVILYLLLLSAIGAGLAFLRMSFPVIFANMRITGFYDLVGIILGAIGGALAAYNAVKLRRMKRNCTVPINALVADHLKGMRKYTKVYDPVYVFTYCGKKYKTCENRYYPKRQVPIVGETEEILIDPENPKSVYVPKRDYRTSVFECILGIFMLLCGMAFPLLIAEINMRYPLT